MNSRTSNTKGVATGVLVLLVFVLSVGGFLTHRYKEWRSASSSPEIADTLLEPLGKLSLGPLHMGAAFTAVVGGSYGGYCDSSSSIVTPHTLLLSSRDCYALNLSVTIGARGYSLVIPMPQ